MSFWGEFDGSSAAKRIGRAQQTVDQTTRGSYNDARTSANRGMAGFNRDMGRARGAINQGVDRASQTVNQGLGQAQGTLQPYQQQGGHASALYGRHLGLEGQEAQRQAVQSFTADPFRQFNEDNATNAILRGFNARGMVDSGASRLASARASQETGTRDYNAFLDRLAGQQSMGANMATNAAGMQMDASGRIGGMQYGGGNTISSLYGQQAGQRYNHGMMQGQLAIGQGEALNSNLINSTNAQNAARAQGVNNIVGLGTTIASMAMGMPPGTLGQMTDGLQGMVSGGPGGGWGGMTGYRQYAAGMHRPSFWTPTEG